MYLLSRPHQNFAKLTVQGFLEIIFKAPIQDNGKNEREKKRIWKTGK